MPKVPFTLAERRKRKRTPEMTKEEETLRGPPPNAAPLPAQASGLPRLVPHRQGTRTIGPGHWLTSFTARDHQPPGSHLTPAPPRADRLGSQETLVKLLGVSDVQRGLETTGLRAQH